MNKDKIFNIVFVSENKGVGIEPEAKAVSLKYKGERLVLKQR